MKPHCVQVDDVCVQVCGSTQTQRDKVLFCLDSAPDPQSAGPMLSCLRRTGSPAAVGHHESRWGARPKAVNSTPSCPSRARGHTKHYVKRDRKPGCQERQHRTARLQTQSQLLPGAALRQVGLSAVDNLQKLREELTGLLWLD